MGREREGMGEWEGTTRDLEGKVPQFWEEDQGEREGTEEEGQYVEE